MASPTSRTLASLRDQGYKAQVVEKWIPQARKRVDLFGFIDIIMIDGVSIIGIQVTSGTNHAARRKKILTECRDAAIEWLRCGGVIQIRSWRKYAVPLSFTKRKKWLERCQELTLRDFGEEL